MAEDALRIDLPAFRATLPEVMELWSGMLRRAEGVPTKSELIVEFGEDEFEFEYPNDTDGLDDFPDTFSKFRLTVALADRQIEVFTTGDFFSTGWPVVVAKAGDARWRINQVDYIEAFVRRRATVGNNVQRAVDYASYSLPILFALFNILGDGERFASFMMGVLSIPAVRQLGEYVRDWVWKTAVVEVRSRPGFFVRNTPVAAWIAIGVSIANFVLAILRR